MVGETPNLAARLQALAEPGTVVIAPRHAAAARRPVRARRPRPRTRSRASPARCGLAGARARARPRAASRRCTDGWPHAAGRPRAGARAAARPLGAGQGRRGPGGAALGRARHRQVAPRRKPCASGSRGEPHTRLRYYCSPYHHDSALHPVIDQLERAAGFDRDDRARTQARQARGAARAVDAMTVDAGDAAARGAALDPDRRALPAARPDARSGRRSGRSQALLDQLARPGARASRCWWSSRTCTGPTRPRSSCSTSPIERVQRLPVLRGDHLPARVRAALDRPAARHRAHARAA